MVVRAPGAIYFGDWTRRVIPRAQHHLTKAEHVCAAASDTQLGVFAKGAWAE